MSVVAAGTVIIAVRAYPLAANDMISSDHWRMISNAFAPLVPTHLQMAANQRIFIYLKKSILHFYSKIILRFYKTTRPIHSRFFCETTKGFLICPNL